MEIKDLHFRCTSCNKSFTQKKHCIRHIKEEHLGLKLKPIEGKKKVECKNCNNIISKKVMKRHLERNCPTFKLIVPKVYSCKICDFTADKRLILLNHKKSYHESNFTLALGYCQMIDDKRAKCKSCQKMFSRKSYCIRHIKEAHLGIKVKAVAGKKIVNCPICSTSCSQKGLKRHLMTHSGGNTFKCENCDSSFTRLDGLKRHLKNVHQ
jgi:uncharacterized C2H2 Zn-finger protein